MKAVIVMAFKRQICINRHIYLENYINHIQESICWTNRCETDIHNSLCISIGYLHFNFLSIKLSENVHFSLPSLQIPMFAICFFFKYFLFRPPFDFELSEAWNNRKEEFFLIHVRVCVASIIMTILNNTFLFLIFGIVTSKTTEIRYECLSFW